MRKRTLSAPRTGSSLSGERTRGAPEGHRPTIRALHRPHLDLGSEEDDVLEESAGDASDLALKALSELLAASVKLGNALLCAMIEPPLELDE